MTSALMLLRRRPLIPQEQMFYNSLKRKGKGADVKVRLDLSHTPHAYARACHRTCHGIQCTMRGMCARSGRINVRLTMQPETNRRRT